MSQSLKTLTEISSRILNEPEHEIAPDTPVEDLGFDDDEWRDMLEEACEIRGVNLAELVNTMPVYRLKRSDSALASLSEIAAFSPKAAQMLADSTTQVHLDTLRSLATSMDEGRYVPSGLMSDDLHTPNKPFWVIGKGIALSSLALGLPFLNAFGPCNPICRDCFAPPLEKFWEIGVFSFPIFAIITAFWFGPGLYEMWYDSQKNKKRGKLQNKRELGSELPPSRAGLVEKATRGE